MNKSKNIKKGTALINNLVNEKIKTPKVRLISNDGLQLGIFSRNEALEKAQSFGLDLVLIDEKSNPPVAKILDFGKFKYEQEKKKKKEEKKQRKLLQETAISSGYQST
jgi:translation initiation factor IF-3